MPVTTKQEVQFDSDGLPIPQTQSVSSIKFDSDGLPIPQKKSSVLSVGADGQLKQSSPTTSESHSPDEVDVKALADQNKAANPNASEFDSFNPIDLAKNADELSKKTISQSGANGTEGGGVLVTPDFEAIKQSKKINDYLAKNNIDAKELNRVFGDMPDAAFDMTPGDSKVNLFSEWKANPIDTENKVNNIKTQYALKQAGNDWAGNDFMIRQGTQVNFLNEYYNKIKNQQDLIGANLTGEERDKAMQRLQETSSPNINAANPQLVEQYKNSPLSSVVSPDEYAGLETERLFNPQKYQTDLNILQSKPDAVSNLKPTNISEAAQQKIGIDEQIGKENIHRQLLNIGRQNTYTKLTADQYNLESAFKQTDDPIQQEQINNQYFDNQQKINGLKTDAQADDARFPLSANLKFDNQVKEITGQSGIGMMEYGTKRFGKGFTNTAETAEDLLTNLFGSDESKAKLQAERIGGTQTFQNQTYLPSNLSGADEGLKASKDLQAQADAIIKGRDISDLSPQERQNLNDLVARNPDQITTVSNDKGKNFFSKATGYKVAGFTGDVGSFMVQIAGLKGLGLAAKTAEAATLFNTTFPEFYNEGIAKGMSPSLATQYGILHGGVMMLAGAVSSKYDAVKEMLGEGKSAVSKEILGMGENKWNEIVNNNLPMLKKIADRAKSEVQDIVSNTAKQAATFGVGTTIINRALENSVFNEHHTISQIVDEAYQNTKDLATGIMAIGGAGFILHIAKSPITTLDKINFWENGVNPEIGKARIDEAVANNQITQEQGNLRKKAIDNMANIIQKVPIKNDRGKDMTDAERIEYGYNLFLKGKAKEAVADLPPKQSEDAEFSGLVAEHKNQILLSQPTDKQLQTQKIKLEKALIPEKDELGKNIEIPPKELMQTKAELEAVNDAIKNKASDKIQNTTQQLQDANRSDVVNLIGKFRPNKEANWGYEDLAKAYHEAKDNSSNPELVREVEKVIGSPEVSERSKELLTKLQSTNLPKEVEPNKEVIPERTDEEINQIKKEKILEPDKMEQKVTIPDFDEYKADTKELPLKKVKSIDARDELRKRLKTIENIIKCL